MHRSGDRAFQTEGAPDAEILRWNPTGVVQEQWNSPGDGRREKQGLSLAGPYIPQSGLWLLF